MAIRLIALGATLIAAVVCTACDVDFSPTSARSAERPIPVYVEIVAAERSLPALHLPAVVEPTSSRLLAFQYAGRIARVRVAPGERVGAGEIVAEFDLAALAQRVEVARVAVERAQQQVARGATRSDRRRQLFEFASGPGPWSAPVDIEAVVRQSEERYARAVLAGAEARFEAGALRAPVAGIIDRQFRSAGAVASAGEPVVRLSAFHTVALRAAVPRSVSNLIREGGRGGVRIGEELREGSIRSVDGEAGADGGVPFELWVDNFDLLLQPGDVVEIIVAVEGGENASSISLGAVQRGVDARPFCFAIVGEGTDLRVERRPVVLGGLRGDRVLLIAGLDPGERVVSLGNELLTFGDPVTIVGEGR
jgi:RND family efflux transporter MFP subunit